MNRWKFQAIIFITIIATVAGLFGKFHSHDSYQGDSSKVYEASRVDGLNLSARSPMSAELGDVAAHFCFACQSLKSFFQGPFFGLEEVVPAPHGLSSYLYVDRNNSRRLFQPPRS